MMIFIMRNSSFFASRLIFGKGLFMLTNPLRQTNEYKRLLAAAAGKKPAVTALFGMPPDRKSVV